MLNPEAQTPKIIERNPENLPELKRIIGSAIIISADGYVLMGRKDPSKGGVYPDAWHIPGGGADEGETPLDAAVREVKEEVGLDIEADTFKEVPIKGGGEHEKTLKTGERVWVIMEFNRFEVRLPYPASEIQDKVAPSDDLVELHWFSPEELPEVEQIPGGKEFFIEAGYIK